jgi:hypothetical protein
MVKFSLFFILFGLDGALLWRELWLGRFVRCLLGLGRITVRLVGAVLGNGVSARVDAGARVCAAIVGLGCTSIPTLSLNASTQILPTAVMVVVDVVAAVVVILVVVVAVAAAVVAVIAPRIASQ